MFSTLDSQPQEWLVNDPNTLHTICACNFRDSGSARRWIHQLVPRDHNRQFVKWSGRARRADRARRRRLSFIESVERHHDDMDFKIHCISSTEAEISEFAQVFYLQNLGAMSQELNDQRENCLVFRINEQKVVKVPVLRAARLLWVYWVLKYLYEEHGMTGFVYSDWFAGDNYGGEDPALGVGLVNFLLKATAIDLQLSIAKDPKTAEADLLSDWFAGWANGAKSGALDQGLTQRFEALTERQSSKVDWIRFRCVLNVQIQREAADRSNDNHSAE